MEAAVDAVLEAEFAVLTALFAEATAALAFVEAVLAVDTAAEAAVLAEVDNRINQFVHQPTVIVRSTAKGVLPGARDGDAISGAVHDAKIFLFLDQLGSVRDVQKTLFHELLHYGLRRIYSREQFTAEMHKLYQRDASIKAFADQWIKTNEGEIANNFGGADYAVARGVDEALAREAFRLAAAKLPLLTTFVVRQVGQ
mgnify:CR=1 FL=1